MGTDRAISGQKDGNSQGSKQFCVFGKAVLTPRTVFDIPWVAMRKHHVLLVQDEVPCPSVPSAVSHSMGTGHSAVTPLQACLAVGRVEERRHQIPEIKYCSSNTLCWLPLHQGLLKGGQLPAREQRWKFDVLMVSFCQRPRIQAQHWPHSLVSPQEPFPSLLRFSSPGFALLA